MIVKNNNYNGFIKAYAYTKDMTLYKVCVFRECRFLWFFKRMKLYELPFFFDDHDIAKQFLDYQSHIKHCLSGLMLQKNFPKFRYFSIIDTSLFALHSCYMLVDKKIMQIRFKKEHLYVRRDKKLKIDVIDYEPKIFESCSTGYDINDNFYNLDEHCEYINEILIPKKNTKNFYNLKDFVKFVL